MKTRLLLSFIILILLFTACSYPAFLPPASLADKHPNGAYIQLRTKTGDRHYGELIAADTTNLYILLSPEYHSIKKCIKVPAKDVERYKVRLVRPKNYTSAVILFPLATPFIHGILSVVSAPINLLVTASVAASSHNSFVFKANEAPLPSLYRFARFPGGIPDGVALSSIQ